MKSNHKLVRSFLLTVTFAGVCGIVPATAASACKGLDTKACSSESSCRWVASYERKDGRQVKAFCRTSPVAKKSAKTKSVAAKSQ